MALIDELHRQSAYLSPASLLDLALDRSGYHAWLATQSDGRERLSHLATLRRLAERAGGDLDTWLAELQLGEEDATGPDDRERVLLTTIHRAKGGEWRVVFVAGLEDGLLPHHRALGTKSIAGTAVTDERRVAYVAVTRPRDRLYVTYCRIRRRDEQAEPRRPSRFLRGLPLDQIEPAA
ncbi:UvrD/REP helicase (fragment) [Nitrolancea hollandica Lb]|uniref:DNA 3'-5' helicase II n=1 Tax=Nitrolancea hollandica Lb TaxID=1129897 RepID=I4EL74_9BACT